MLGILGTHAVDGSATPADARRSAAFGDGGTAASSVLWLRVHVVPKLHIFLQHAKRNLAIAGKIHPTVVS